MVMKRATLPVLLLALAAGAACAQAGAPSRVVVLNYTTRIIDVRLGEVSSPALSLPGVAATSVSQLTGARAGKAAVYYRAQGAKDWTTIRARSEEGAAAEVQTYLLSPGKFYALGIHEEGEELAALFQELETPTGSGPLVLFAATRMGPPRSATLLDPSRRPASVVLTVDTITQYEVSGPYALPAAGKLSVAFTWPAFFEDRTYLLPDPRDPAKPGVFDFRDGSVYAVVLESFDEKGATGSVTTIVSQGPSGTTPGDLTSVPRSWNGDWATEIRPTTKALAVRNGKIYLVNNNRETQVIPATGAGQYTYTYHANEVASYLGGRLQDRYVLSEDGNKITHFQPGKSTVYVRTK